MSFIVGDVIRYDTSEWCRHGIAIVRGADAYSGLWASDTYWSSSDSLVPLEKLEGKPIIGNVTTFAPKIPYPYVYEDFDEEDKFYIPMGGGSAQQWVRIGAKPSTEKVVERLRYELEKAHDKVKYAAKDVEWATKNLMKFETRTAEFAEK